MRVGEGYCSNLEEFTSVFMDADASVTRSETHRRKSCFEHQQVTLPTSCSWPLRVAESLKSPDMANSGRYLDG